MKGKIKAKTTEKAHTRERTVEIEKSAYQRREGCPVDCLSLRALMGIQVLTVPCVWAQAPSREGQPRTRTQTQSHNEEAENISQQPKKATHDRHTSNSQKPGLRGVRTGLPYGPAQQHPPCVSHPQPAPRLSYSPVFSRLASLFPTHPPTHARTHTHIHTATSASATPPHPPLTRYTGQSMRKTSCSRCCTSSMSLSIALHSVSSSLSAKRALVAARLPISISFTSV